MSSTCVFQRTKGCDAPLLPLETSTQALPHRSESLALGHWGHVDAWGQSAGGTCPAQAPGTKPLRSWPGRDPLFHKHSQKEPERPHSDTRLHPWLCTNVDPTLSHGQKNVGPPAVHSIGFGSFDTGKGWVPQPEVRPSQGQKTKPSGFSSGLFLLRCGERSAAHPSHTLHAWRAICLPIYIPRRLSQVSSRAPWAAPPASGNAASLPTERAPRGHRLPPAPAPPPRQVGHLQSVGLPRSSPHPTAFVSAAAHGPKLQGMKTLVWDPSCDLPRALGAPLPPWGAFPPSLDGRTSRWYALFLPKPQG